ncbi:Zinc finger Ran-binding domain-containing protein 2 [Euphorbia peplus]|nr:Zinc finger Ran-binding domain-containing protein 2 [Euphorbia peplus]
MGSRDKDQPHQPLLSSLVIRPAVTDAGDAAGGGRAGATDYEPGEVRRDPPPYSRNDRYSDDPGYRIHAGSGSPPRRRDADHRYNSDFNHSGGPPRGRDFGGGRDPGRFRESSPPYPRGRIGGRPPGRGFDGPGFGPGPFRGDGGNRNNPNVRPREGDWICSDPLCGNLNFARREYCNNCKRPRYGPGGSPRRGGYPGPPPPHAAPRRFPGPPLDVSPGRTMNGYRSPPRGWARDGPRDFVPGGLPPPRHGGRIPDHDMRRGRPDYPDDEFRGRGKFDRPMSMDWAHRDRGRDLMFNERKGFDRRLPSPPLPPPPQRGRWGRDVRERSRSPIRGGPPPKDFRRDMYLERGRDDRRDMGGRDRVGDVY